MSKYLFIVGMSLILEFSDCFSLCPGIIKASRSCQNANIVQMNLRPNPESGSASGSPMSRRSVLGAAGALIAGGFAQQIAPATAKLDPRPPTPDDLLVYFGAGCFWHMQVCRSFGRRLSIKSDLKLAA